MNMMKISGLLLMFLISTVLVNAITCYQETADNNTTKDGKCGLYYGGAYVDNTGLLSAGYDGIANTHTVHNEEAILFETWKKPINPLADSKVRIYFLKANTVTYKDLSIPSECWNAHPWEVSFIQDARVYYETDLNYLTIDCLGVGRWVEMYRESYTYPAYPEIYDSAMLWSVDRNILWNSGFDTGFVWNFYTNGKAVTTYNNEATIKIVAKGTNTQLYQYEIPAKANTNYKLSFKAKAEKSGNMQLSFIKHGIPYTNYGLNRWNVKLTNTWKNYAVTFKTNMYAKNDARLMFWLANGVVGETYHIDDVKLEVQ